MCHLQLECVERVIFIPNTRHWACHTLLGLADVLNARWCAQTGSFSHPLHNDDTLTSVTLKVISLLSSHSPSHLHLSPSLLATTFAFKSRKYCQLHNSICILLLDWIAKFRKKKCGTIVVLYRKIGDTQNRLLSYHTVPM